MTTRIISRVVEELNTHVDPSYNLQYFFKEPIKALGVRSPDIWKIMRKTFPKHLSKKDLINECGKLLDQGIYEYSVIAFHWAYLSRDKFDLSDFATFEGWLYKYVDNWGLCDTYAPYVLNHFLTNYPELISNVKEWTKSNNRIVRRASAVIFLRDALGVKPSLQKISERFLVAKELLDDEEDIVQKGCGWLLKNASKTHLQEVFDFVMKNKHKMKRTALRYAIEKMPKELREKAMKNG